MIGLYRITLKFVIDYLEFETHIMQKAKYENFYTYHRFVFRDVNY